MLDLPTDADPVRVLQGDCVELLPQLPASCADLVFADPPFNIGYAYDEYDDRRTRADYLTWADTWLAEAVRVLSPIGSLFLAINDDYVADYKQRLDGLGLTMRNWIIWHYTFGPHQEKKFGRDHAHVLYYVRDPDHFTFNGDAVRVQSQRQRSGDKRANPKGRVPGDVWSFPRVTGNAKERTAHPCQMPEQILDRIILATTNKGELIVDPFAGSGTTAASAAKLWRRAVSCELSLTYAQATRERAEMKLCRQPGSLFAIE